MKVRFSLKASLRLFQMYVERTYMLVFGFEHIETEQL